MNVIETSNLVRYFGASRAVAGLDLQVPAGSIFGLLGENDCGKTTSINLIMGALIPNQGSVRVFGEDPLTMAPATRARIGYLADQMELPGWMTLKEAVRVHGSYFADWDPHAVWQLLDESDVAPEQRFGQLIDACPQPRSARLFDGSIQHFLGEERRLVGAQFRCVFKDLHRLTF